MTAREGGNAMGSYERPLPIVISYVYNFAGFRTLTLLVLRS